MKGTALLATALLLVIGAGWYWAYLGRVELVAAQRTACRDDVWDRQSDVAVRITQAWAAQQIADDPRQPRRTRAARALEAAQDRASVRDRLTRINARARTAVGRQLRNPSIARLLVTLDTGRRLDCAREHPAASLLP